MSRRLKLPVAASAIAAVLALTVPCVAQADLTPLRPSASDSATFTGTGGYSADGLGQAGTGGTVQADVPSGSKVVRAYLYGTYHDGSSPDLAQRTINFDGVNVVLTQIDSLPPFLATARAEVTAQVAAKVGSGGAVNSFAVNNDPGLLDGVTLLVIFSNPQLPQRRIAVFDGSAEHSGDSATFDLVTPLDKTTASFSAVMSLGIGYSAQFGGPGHSCENNIGSQVSIVQVNGSLLTSCAGSFDDGALTSSALLTVGGVGDSTDNPTPPDFPATDDELYDLAPFLHQGDTAVTITTSNPSGDDNLFLAVMEITVPRRPTSKDQCKNGGWRNFGVFKNEGDCVSFVASGGKNPAAGH